MITNRFVTQAASLKDSTTGQVRLSANTHDTKPYSFEHIGLVIREVLAATVK